MSDAHDLPNRSYELAEAILDGNDVTTLLPEPIVKRKFFSKF